MLKSRLIPCIITKGSLVVQSFGFDRYLPIGNIKTAIEFFVNWDVDEIIIIDIDASKQNKMIDSELVKWAAKECFVPLTVGGGIRSTEDINDLLKAGADKVSINSIALDDSDFVSRSSKIFGSQCVTVSIDVKDVGGEYRVFDYRTKSFITENLNTYVKKIEGFGAGEILLNSVDRDGSRLGYDTDLLSGVSSQVSIPVIALGGVGRFDHLAKGIVEGGCQAVAAANIFQHVEHSTIAAKAQLREAGVPVRLSSKVKYESFDLDILGRPF